MRRVLSGLAERPSALLALLLILLVISCAIAAPWLAPYSPDAQPFDGLSIDGAPLPPSIQHWLGTDTLGRDLLSRLLFGARTSLIIGLAANGVAVIIGMVIGTVAGYLGKGVGSVLMRFTDLMMAFPALLLAIVLAALLRPSLWIVALVIAMVNWVQVARIVYTETRGLVERDFILAERSLGAGHARILFRHIVPHLVPTAIVWGTLGIATTVLLEATLSFLGRRGAAAGAVLGQHHLREPELLSGGTLACLHSGGHHPGDGACRSTCSATRCATCSIRPSGAGADGAGPGAAAGPGDADPASASRSSPSSFSTTSRPTRQRSSPAAAQAPPLSPMCATSWGSISLWWFSSGAISRAWHGAISAAPTSSGPRSRC